jgi:hypothetical protein
VCVCVCVCVCVYFAHSIIYIYIYIYIHTYIIYIYRYIRKDRYIRTNRQTDKQTGTQTHTQAHRKTPPHRRTQTHTPSILRRSHNRCQNRALRRTVCVCRHVRYTLGTRAAAIIDAEIDPPPDCKFFFLRSPPERDLSLQ